MGARLARRVLPLPLLALVGVGVAMAMSTSPHGGTVKAAHNAKFGSLLVNSSGMTLYHMTSETRGAIKCTGACAKFWPPLVAGGKVTAGSGATASKLGTIKRPDGRLQVTYNGLALYRFASDRKPGDVKGQGVEKIWFAVTPAGKLAKAGTGGPVVTAPTTTDSGGYGYGGGGGG